MDDKIITFLSLTSTTNHVLSLGRACAMLQTSPADLVARMAALNIQAAICIDDRAYFNAADVKKVAELMDFEDKAKKERREKVESN